MTEIEVVVSDLATDQILELCFDYWKMSSEDRYVHTVTSLAKKYDLRSSEVSKVVKEHSDAVVPSISCRVCGGSFAASTRADLATLLRNPPGQCRECLIAAAESTRLAAELQTTLRGEAVAKHCTIVDAVEGDLQPEELSLREAFSVAALLDAGEELGDSILPTSERPVELAPTKKFTDELITDLYRNHIINVHPATTVEAFEWEGERPAGLQDPAEASWYISGTGSPHNRAVRYLESFNQIFKREDWPSHWIDEFPALWTELCTSECELYLVSQLAKRGMSFSPGGKTRETLLRGLQYYALGEMYYFIYCAAASAADSFARGQANKQRAANSAITRLSGMIDQYYTDGRVPKSYKQNHGSTLWHLLIVRALNLPSPETYSPSIRTRSVLGLRWSQLDATAFERLIFQMVEEAPEYEEVQWLMRTNAPDHGRDVSAMRAFQDSLSGRRQLRVVIQCKHWQSRSINLEDIAREAVAIEHWEHPPFEVLVMATSGRFTADAVTWKERHNSKGVRPYIELWNDAHLERLLADRPHLVLAYELR